MLQQYIMEEQSSSPAQLNNMSMHRNALRNILQKIARITTLITVQFEYAPGDHGFGLKSRLGIPLGTSLTGM